MGELRVRIAPRWKRVLKWPLMVYRHYRITPNLRMAIEWANASVRMRVGGNDNH